MIRSAFEILVPFDRAHCRPELPFFGSKATHVEPAAEKGKVAENNAKKT